MDASFTFIAFRESIPMFWNKSYMYLYICILISYVMKILQACLYDLNCSSFHTGDKG